MCGLVPVAIDIVEVTLFGAAVVTAAMVDVAVVDALAAAGLVILCWVVEHCARVEDTVVMT